MKPIKLNKKEKDWLNKLQTVLSECPSNRFSAFTVGDNDITLYDKRFDTAIHEKLDRGNYDFGPAAVELNAVLFEIVMPFPIHSTAG